MNKPGYALAYKKKMRALGRCPNCGQKTNGKHMCETCLDKEAIRKRGRKREKSCIPRPKAFWKTVDWTLTNQDLAEELGVTKQAIAYQRKKHTSKL